VQDIHGWSHNTTKLTESTQRTPKYRIKIQVIWSYFDLKSLRRGNRGGGCPQNGIPEGETRKKERGAYLEHNGGKRSIERDAVWNCGFPRETRDLERERERERGGKTAAAAERVKDREVVLNFRFIGLGQLEA
jgi:hypothetical protein